MSTVRMEAGSLHLVFFFSHPYGHMAIVNICQKTIVVDPKGLFGGKTPCFVAGEIT